MNSLPKSVHLTEEGPREGFQIEKAVIPTADKVRLIHALADTGIPEIQVTAFVNPKKVPGMADADEVSAALQSRPGVKYSALWFNRRGFERAQASGKLNLKGKINYYGSDAFLRRNLDRTAEQHAAEVGKLLDEYQSLGVPVQRIGITAAFGCNFEGDVPLDKVMTLIASGMVVARERGIKIREVSLSDTMAWANPLQIARTVGSIKERYPEVRVALHLHDTRGLGLANALAGMQEGADLFESAIAGLGGCPFAAHQGAAGNIATEDFVFMCEEMGVDTGVNLDRLVECAAMAEEIVGRTLPGMLLLGGPLSTLRAKNGGRA